MAQQLQTNYIIVRWLHTDNCNNLVLKVLIIEKMNYLCAPKSA